MSNFRILPQEQIDTLNPEERSAYSQDIIDGMQSGAVIVTENGYEPAASTLTTDERHYQEVKRLHGIASTISKVDDYQTKIERAKVVAEGFASLASQTSGKLKSDCEKAAKQYDDMVGVFSKAAKSRRAAKSVVDAANRERAERQRKAEEKAKLDAEQTAIENAASVREAREARQANAHNDFVLAERAKSIEKQRQRQARVDAYRAEQAAEKARKIEAINVERRREGLPDIDDPKRFNK